MTPIEYRSHVFICSNFWSLCLIRKLESTLQDVATHVDAVVDLLADLVLAAVNGN